jgi:hypothetical protein
MNIALRMGEMSSQLKTKGLFLSLLCAVCFWLCGSAQVEALEAKETTLHFGFGEMRTTLSWDNISAMETGVLKFGGSAGIHVFNGVEVGFEQAFIMPPELGTESRSWAYLRVVPFRDWLVNPFLAARVGYYVLPDEQALGVGAGCGLVMFVSDNIAFEASLFTQAVMHPESPVERQTEFDWRVVLYF